MQIGQVLRTVAVASGIFLAATSARALDRTGFAARITGGLHDVEAICTIVDTQTILVEHFTYDGTAPAVYFYLGATNTQAGFVNGLQVEPRLDRAYADESLVLTLPPGRTLDDYTAISVWCAAFDINFGSAVFKTTASQDADNDGDVDLGDYDTLADCLAGPDQAPAPLSTTPAACLEAFDTDADADVDLADAAAFQRAFTGSPSTTATYQVTFNATWSASTHPQDFPSNAHFSPLVGGTHAAGVHFWQPGQLASQGIKDMAERGLTAPLLAEVNAQISLGTAESTILGGACNSPGQATANLAISQEFPLVTLVTMVAPSPDWFVGVDALPLFVNNHWLGQYTVSLGPWDAGTDSGTTYTSPNAVSNPRQNIFPITGYPFLNGIQVLPLGTFTFTRTDAD